MRDVKYYERLSYTAVLRRDEDGDIVARIAELPGCASHGTSEREALKHLEEAKRMWIKESIKSGLPVPEPEPENVLPSGRWVQRVPRRLHRKLTILAKEEGVSLNQLVTALLAEGVGIRYAALRPRDSRRVIVRGQTAPFREAKSASMK